MTQTEKLALIKEYAENRIIAINKMKWDQLSTSDFYFKQGELSALNTILTKLSNH